MNDQATPKLNLADEFQTDMQLEIAGMHGRFKSVLVGVIHEEVLIFHISPKFADPLQRLTKNQNITVTVRGISRGMAFGFKGAAIKFVRHPKSILLVAYPAQIQTQVIRETHRVKCLLPCDFAKDEVTVKGVIADISTSGCHFKTQIDISEEQASAMQLNNDVEMKFTLPGRDKAITQKAIIRNTFMDDHKIDIGFQFDDIQEDTIQIIQEFIDLSFDIEPLQ